MASTYALPVSPLPHSPHNHFRQHSHPGHSHSHSHSHSRSPSRLAPAGARSAYSPRPMQNGSTHSHSHSAHVHSPANTYHDSQSRTNSVSSVHEDSAIPPYLTADSLSSNAEKSPYSNGYSNGSLSSPLYSEFTGVEFSQPADDHTHHHHTHGSHSHDDHCGHAHNAAHNAKAVEPRSRCTKFLLRHTLNFPLLQSILLEKDSRRIFYFMSLNFAFMIVQAFYGFATDSLGLLSDSIHMFFDCIALGLGLFAAVASKWPSSQRFPYGFGKIESLSGFGNGVFLMLISIEIIIEAIERLAEGHETKRLKELFIVSSLGLAVNLVGMACFGHHHHGHDHSHGGHDHDEKHDHHDHDHSHDHHHHDSHSHMSLTSDISVPAPKHSHSHSHENENMHGIFLHVLADTMGSAAVIVSTVLIHYLGWPGWDPLASCLIAGLIFLSSLPLVSSCGKRLLLTVPADTEYQLRETLSGVSDLRGVASYSVPRFWMADRPEVAEGDAVLGMMHVIATRGSDLDDVRERTRTYLSGHGMDVVVQVEREGEAKCWCGGDGARTPSNPTARF